MRKETKLWLFCQRVRTAFNVLRSERFFIYYTLPKQGDDYHANWQAMRVMDAHQIRQWGHDRLVVDEACDNLLTDAKDVLGLPSESDD